MKRLVLLVAAMGMLAFAGSAQAATATLFGSATVEGDHVTSVSNFMTAATTDDFGGVKFTDTGVTTFNSLTTLSAEFNVTDDACRGGSPRFEIDFAGTTNNLFVYLGTYNSTTGGFDCAPNTWIDSGNLLASPDPRFDTSKFAGGTFYSTATQAKTLLGTMTIEEIRFVVDGGWSFSGATEDKEQTVQLRKATVNANVFTWREQQPPAGPNPAQTCRALRTAMEAASAGSFALAWGDNTNRRNAFGKCVSHHAKLKSQATASAARACAKAGKRGQELQACVAERSAATFTARTTAFKKAGVTCAKERRTTGKAAFKAKYGRGALKVNAMQACIAAKQ